MRTRFASVLASVVAVLFLPVAAKAQSNPPASKTPDSVLHRLSLSSEFPEFQKNADSQAGGSFANPSPEPNRLNDKKGLQEWLLQKIDPALMAGSSACGHILIYVPPVTDTKMIIKVPESAANGQKTPSVKACGEDLRRVDAPRPVPPAAPSGNGVLVPLHTIANFH